MRLWITGGDGFVAKAAQRLCKKEGIDCVATSREEADITSPQHLKKFLRNLTGSPITHLVNCAAYTDVDKAEQEKEAASLINSCGPEILGEIARQHDFKMVHLSTDYVFGGGSRPFLETDPCSPLNVYATTKLEGEIRLLETYPQACILRTSWVFGTGGKNFVSSLVNKLRNEKKIYISSEQRNRLTYVHDLAEALISMLGYSGIFHFANQGETSRFEVATAMKLALQEKGIKVACQEIIPETPPSVLKGAKRPLYSVLDTTKIETTFGLAPRHWKTALKEFVSAL
jgi:dTDP-4-dehydrorhamnose reductase